MYEDEIAAFKRNHGYEIDLKNPKSFNEKIVYKKFFDRNPLLPLTADKYRARDYIREKIGDEAEAHLVPLIWHGQNPVDIPFGDLPDKYIIKPNNGSGRYILKNNGYVVNLTKKYNELTKEQIISICNDWFKDVHGAQWYEWAYSQIEPCIVIEELLVEKNHVPMDFRFFMFNGVCRIVCVTVNEFYRRYNNYYDKNWNLLPFTKGATIGEFINKPKDFDLMNSYAEKLSGPFDFVRIDFFVCNDNVYFSEITHYVASGWTPIKPVEWDFITGSWWKLGDY